MIFSAILYKNKSAVCYTVAHNTNMVFFVLDLTIHNLVCDCLKCM